MVQPTTTLPKHENGQEEQIVLQEASLAQRKEIFELLSANKLPVNDLVEGVKLYALTHNGSLVGSAGLELYGNKALLRSVSVADGGKGMGLGKLISKEIETIARKAGVEELFLVTTTAEGFFGKLGYRSIQRDEVPQAVLVSGQFNGICPSSAAIMKKAI